MNILDVMDNIQLLNTKLPFQIEKIPKHTDVPEWHRAEIKEYREYLEQDTDWTKIEDK